MAVVKITNKNELDKLVASLTLKIGKKVPQQTVIDLCVRFASMHLDELEKIISPQKSLSPSRIQEILNSADDFDFDDSKTIDETLYSI